MQNKVFHKIVETHTFKYTDVFFKMNALIGELGELANILKKQKFYAYFKDIEELDRTKEKLKTKPEDIEEELGDLLFYVYQIMNDLNYSADAIMIIQKMKLDRQSDELNRTFVK